MADFIYDVHGRPQGFRLGKHLYDLQGHAVGRISAESVYRFDGRYVGELYKNMVVEKPVGGRRNLQPLEPPENAILPGNPSQRPPVQTSYREVFEILAMPDGGLSMDDAEERTERS